MYLGQQLFQSFPTQVCAVIASIAERALAREPPVFQQLTPCHGWARNVNIRREELLVSVNIPEGMNSQTFDEGVEPMEDIWSAGVIQASRLNGERA